MTPTKILRVLISPIILLLWAEILLAAPRPVNTAKSVLTLHVHKAGVLGGLGHDHEVTAPIAGGSVDIDARTVEIKVNATALKVADKNDSEKDRAEIQQNMLGPEVLDAQRYSEITFRSKSAEPQGENAWRVQGELTLHGETRPVEAEVRGDNGHYRGTVRLRQSEFGIKPVKMAGGAVRVKDEVSIDFDIELAR
jgi:polyisoprenoid-binding protein YceI